jgi:hypothetical protein
MGKILVHSVAKPATVDPLFTNLPFGRFRLKRQGQPTVIDSVHLNFCMKDPGIVVLNPDYKEPKKPKKSKEEIEAEKAKAKAEAEAKKKAEAEAKKKAKAEEKAKKKAEKEAKEKAEKEAKAKAAADKNK